jgi:hypothetical protein
LIVEYQVRKITAAEQRRRMHSKSTFSPRLMRTMLVVVVCLAMIPAISCAGETGTIEQPGTDLYRLTQQRFTANANNDRQFYQQLLADNFLMLEPFGKILNKPAYLAQEFGLRPDGYHGTAATIDAFQAHILGDVATASYLAIEPTMLGDQRFESRSHRLDTYVRQKGKWRLLSMGIAVSPNWPEVAKIDTRVYQDYVGIYQFSPTTQIVISEENGRLMAAVTGQAKVELFPENPSTFFDRSDDPSARTVFERNAHGKVIAQIHRTQGQSTRAIKRVEE